MAVKQRLNNNVMNTKTLKQVPTVAAMMAADARPEVIAAATGLSYTTVHTLRRAIAGGAIPTGRKPRQQAPLQARTAARAGQVKDLYALYKCVSKVARITELSPPTVRKILKCN